MIIAKNETTGLGMLDVMNLLNDSAANEEQDTKKVEEEEQEN